MEKNNKKKTTSEFSYILFDTMHIPHHLYTHKKKTKNKKKKICFCGALKMEEKKPCVLSSFDSF